MQVEPLMSDQLLAELWAADEPPAADPAFVLEAMERVERRRFLLGVAALVPVMATAALVLWALSPVVAAVAAFLPARAASLGPVAAAVVMSLFLWSWISGRLQPLEA